MKYAILLLSLLSLSFAPPPDACACVVTEKDLNLTAGPNDPACSGANPVGPGQLWGYNCGTVNQRQWLIDQGCVVSVVP